MRSFFQSFLAVCTAVLLLFGTVPKDFMHDWTAHTDTIHAAPCDGHEEGFIIEESHHHCRFIKLLVTAFGAPHVFRFVPVFRLEHRQETVERAFVYSGTPRSQRCLRGPPAA